MLNCLVTGGAGFIGSHVVDLLVQAGWSVRVLDNFSSGSRITLAQHRSLDVVDGDIRDPDLCREVCRDVDHVFHLAAIASVPASLDDPISTHEVNAGGTLNLLCAARDQRVRRFVFSSSASVYGNCHVVPTSEDQRLSPASPYATSKAAGEFYCFNFRELYGLETVVLRYFNVFGPRQSANSSYAAVIPRFVDAAIGNRSPIVYGDGLQTRDFVYVESVARANLLAAVAANVAGQAFNIAGGEQISLLDLLDRLREITGAQMTPTFAPATPGDVRHSRADISAAQRLLGYRPTIGLTEGLRRTVAAAARETVDV